MYRLTCMKSSMCEYILNPKQLMEYTCKGLRSTGRLNLGWKENEPTEWSKPWSWWWCKHTNHQETLRIILWRLKLFCIYVIHYINCYIYHVIKHVGLNAILYYKSRFTLHDTLISKLKRTITMQQLVYMKNTGFKRSNVYQNTVST
jgi:hypothetical protein